MLRNLSLSELMVTPLSRLFLIDVPVLQPLDDNKTLGDCGFTSQTARAQAPATIGLAFKLDGG